MIQILGPCTPDVSYNIRACGTDALVYVRAYVTRRAGPRERRHARTCGMRVHAHNARCRSTPNIYTSIHLRRVEGRTLTDVASRRLNSASLFAPRRSSCAMKSEIHRDSRVRESHERLKFKRARARTSDRLIPRRKNVRLTRMMISETRIFRFNALM